MSRIARWALNYCNPHYKSMAFIFGVFPQNQEQSCENKSSTDQGLSHFHLRNLTLYKPLFQNETQIKATFRNQVETQSHVHSKTTCWHIPRGCSLPHVNLSLPRTRSNWPRNWKPFVCVLVLQKLYQDSSFFSLATRIEKEMQTEGRKVTNPERWLKWQQPRDRLLPELRRPCHHSRRSMPRRLDLPRSLPTDPCRLRPPSHSLKQNRSLRVSICFSSFSLVNSQVNSSHKSLCLYLCLCRSASSHLAFSTQAPYCFKPPFSANKEWLPFALQLCCKWYLNPIPSDPDTNNLTLRSTITLVPQRSKLKKSDMMSITTASVLLLLLRLLLLRFMLFWRQAFRSNSSQLQNTRHLFSNLNKKTEQAQLNSKKATLYETTTTNRWSSNPCVQHLPC